MLTGFECALGEAYQIDGYMKTTFERRNCNFSNYKINFKDNSCEIEGMGVANLAGKSISWYWISEPVHWEERRRNKTMSNFNRQVKISF